MTPVFFRTGKIEIISYIECSTMLILSLDAMDTTPDNAHAPLI